MKSWNTWREANPDVRPDLTEADLKDSNLQGVKLREADLQGAILSETNLQGAELAHCNLRGAILQNANLSDVKGLLGGDLGVLSKAQIRPY